MGEVPRKDLIALVLLVTLLGMLGGSPRMHPDSLGERAMDALRDGGNPGFFRYPSLVIYLNAVACKALYESMSLLGGVEGSQSLRVFFTSQRGLLNALGLVITVVFSAAGVVLTYLSAYRLLRDRAFSLLAALFLTTSILWIANSHYATVDIPVATLSLAAVYLTLCMTAAGEPLGAGRMAFLGLWVGLAAAAKYPGAIVAVAVAAATWTCYRGRRGRWLLHSFLAASVSIATFLAVNPFLLLDFESFRSELAIEVRHARAGHFGYATESGWIFHLRESLGSGFGLAVGLLALLGLGWLLVSRKPPLAAKLAVVSFPLAHYLLIGSSRLAFQRYMLPVAPFVALAAAMGAYAAFLFLRSRFTLRTARWVVVAVALGTAVPGLADVVRHDLLLRREDTRSVLERVVREASLEKETTVFVQKYGRQPFRRLDRRMQLKQLQEARLDLVVLDSFDHDRYLYWAGRFARKRLARALQRQDLGGGERIAISPFAAPKDEVPFSPESLYSPYPPDLGWRRAPGPFLEVYVRDAATAGRLFDSCRRLAVDCDRGPSEDGYYYRRLTE